MCLILCKSKRSAWLQLFTSSKKHMESPSSVPVPFLQKSSWTSAGEKQNRLTALRPPWGLSQSVRKVLRKRAMEFAILPLSTLPICYTKGQIMLDHESPSTLMT